MLRRLTLLLGLVAVLTLALAPAVAAHGSRHDGESRSHARHHAGHHGHHQHRLPATIDLPTGFQPEGIASVGSTLYVGSLADGSIWKGKASSGKGRVVIEGTEGQMAVGLHVDGRGRLWVAGGDDQQVRVYRAKGGRLLATYTFPTAGFLNDLVITRKAVYVTDSANQQLAVIRLGGPWGRLPDPADAAKVTTLPITGTDVPAELFANGIVASKDALIIVGTRDGGQLLRVDPKTGAATAIDTGDASVENGDGLLLLGRSLVVVRNQDAIVAVFKLSRDGSSARLVRELTSSKLDVPTTAAAAKGRLWVVNARFGVADPASAEYWITRLPATS